jgi:hypothetical protein
MGSRALSIADTSPENKSVGKLQSWPNRVRLNTAEHSYQRSRHSFTDLFTLARWVSLSLHPIAEDQSFMNTLLSPR